MPRVVLDIDHAVLKENFGSIARAVAPAKVIAVLKANAYGLGMRPVARTLAASGIAGIAVAELSEAMDAADFGVPVILLGAPLPDEIEPAVQHGIRLSIPDLEVARAISASAQAIGKTATCHIALDTGMGRVGFMPEQAPGAVEQIAAMPAIKIEGMYSHFPMAYKYASDFTLNQIEKYKTVIGRLAQKGIDIKWRHIANSDGINNFPESYSAPFTHVRTGINLHGSFDIEGRRSLNLKSVLTMRARLAQVRTLPAGYSVGYGGTFVCPAAMRVGVVAAGYADGLPLALSNRGSILIRGVHCPVIGRVCMDYATVSLEQLPGAAPGDEAVCIGEQEGASISVEEWATLKGTHPYEVICSIGSRVHRNHKLA